MKALKRKNIAIIFIVIVALTITAAVSFFIASGLSDIFDFADVNKLKIINVTRSEINRYVWPTQKKTDVDSVSLYVIPDFEEERITVIEKIYGQKPANSNVILNLSDNAEIVCVKNNGEKTSYVHVNGHLIVPAAGDTLFGLKIKFKTEPEGGLYFSERNGGKYIYTVNEPIFASEWFACNDLPGDKFILTLGVRTEKNLSVIANGKLIGEKILGKEKITTWKTLYPIAPYLTAFYAGNYKKYETEQNGVAIQIYAFPEDSGKAESVASVAKEAINIFESRYGKYPFGKDKFSITEIGWEFGGIENQTAIGIGERFFDAEYFKNIIAHETSHEWFGNCVTVSTWDDVWINEGLASFSEAIYWEGVSGKSGYEAAINSFASGKPCEKIRAREKNLFAREVYEKGALIFSELREKEGDRKFFESLRKYINDYEYSSAAFEQLRKYFDFEKLSPGLKKCIGIN